MQRTIITIAASLFVSLVFVLAVRWPMFVTKYAPNFSEHGLATLMPGSSFDTITNAIGSPLSFTVIAQPDASNGYAPLHMRQFERIPEYFGRQDALLLLRYSKPKIGDVYLAVELILRQGKLLEVRRFTADD